MNSKSKVFKGGGRPGVISINSWRMNLLLCVLPTLLHFQSQGKVVAFNYNIVIASQDQVLAWILKIKIYNIWVHY